METAYAQALWQMIQSGVAPKKAVDLLHENLLLRGRAALMPRIGKAFERIAQRAQERDGVTIMVAHEKDERHAKAAAKEVLMRLGVAGKDAQVTVDDSLIGGWRLEGRETLVDASFKKYLLDMYNRAVA